MCQKSNVEDTNLRLTPYLEGQVAIISSRSSGSGISRSSGSSNRGCGSGHDTRSSGSRSTRGSDYTALYAPCTNIVVPTAIVFAGVHIEGNGHHFAHLNVKLAQAVFAKYAEHTLAGELLLGLEHKFLHLPVIASALGHTTTGLASHDNLTSNFHC